MSSSSCIGQVELADDYRAAEEGYGWDPAHGFVGFALDKRFDEMCVAFRRAALWARNARQVHPADAAMAATILLVDRCLSDFPDEQRQGAIEAAWQQMQRHRARGNTPFAREADRMIERTFCRLMRLHGAMMGIDDMPDGLDLGGDALSVAGF